MSGPYWFGLLLTGSMFLLLTSVFIVLIPVHLKYGHEQKFVSGSRYTNYIAILAISVCFYLAWGFGLPATRPLNLGAVRLVFEVIFIVCSCLLGLVMVLCYCLLSEQVRKAYCQLNPHYRRSHTLQSNTLTDTTPAATNIYVLTENAEVGEHFANPGVTETTLPDYDTLSEVEGAAEGSAAEGSAAKTAPHDVSKATLERMFAEDELDTTF